MNYLRSDMYTRVNRDCPVSVDLHKVDDVVEVVLGDHRFGGDTLHLILDHTDACTRVIEALAEARSRLTTHLHSEANPDTAMSQLDTKLVGPIAS